MAHSTKERLLEAGLKMLLQHGYHDMGIAALLDETGIPKGSFYHHFTNKEDFALKAVDAYMAEVHTGLEQCLGDTSLQPLDRVRAFFEAVESKYQGEGYLGCMLGGLGQELSGLNEVFRKRIAGCFSEIASGLAACLEVAQQQGQLSVATSPQELANLLVDAWEGAALRSRLLRDPAPLMSILDFYFDAVRAR